jgi:hypothetical protein
MLRLASIITAATFVGCFVSVSSASPVSKQSTLPTAGGSQREAGALCGVAGRHGNSC